MQKHSLNLPQSLRINNCAEFKPQLDALLEDEMELTLVGADLESIDAAGAQLLGAIQIEVDKRNGRILWEQPSEALKLASATLGFPNLS